MSENEFQRLGAEAHLGVCPSGEAQRCAAAAFPAAFAACQRTASKRSRCRGARTRPENKEQEAQEVFLVEGALQLRWVHRESLLLFARRVSATSVASQTDCGYPSTSVLVPLT